MKPLEWDFTLPGEAPAAPAKPDFRADNFRPMPSTGDDPDGPMMVYCIGCGDPMTIAEAIAHGCDLPPAGQL